MIIKEMRESEVRIRGLTRAEYMAEYRREHPELWYGKNTCEICGGKYTNNNKNDHYKTIKHNYAVLKKKMEGIEMEKKM